MKSMSKLIFGLLAAALVMGASATAWADKVTLELRGSSVETTDRGYTNLTGDNAPGAGGLALGFEPAFIDGLRLTASVDGTSLNGSRFAGDLSTSWEHQRVMAGADYGVDLFDDRLRPLVRVGFGYSRQALGLTADNVTYRDTDHGLAAMAAGGLEATVLTSEADADSLVERLSLGINLTAGYSWQTAANFDELESQDAPDEPSDDDPWRRGNYDAGTVQVTGFSLSLGLVAGYRF